MTTYKKEKFSKQTYIWNYRVNVRVISEKLNCIIKNYNERTSFNFKCKTVYSGITFTFICNNGYGILYCPRLRHFKNQDRLSIILYKNFPFQILKCQLVKNNLCYSHTLFRLYITFPGNISKDSCQLSFSEWLTNCNIKCFAFKKDVLFKMRLKE